MDTVIVAPASCEVRAVIRFLHAEGQSAAALCPSAWRKRITARTSQLAGAAMTVSMFYQYLLLHYAAKINEGTHTARIEVPCYYWACALTLWQRVYFYQPIGGWFWNNPRTKQFSQCRKIYYDFLFAVSHFFSFNTFLYIYSHTNLFSLQDWYLCRILYHIYIRPKI